MISYVKLGVRVIAWYWKYFTQIRPLVGNGGIVLADRFIFDDIRVDPLKYRYAGSVSVAEKVTRLLPQPDVYILLEASEAVLVERKPETDPTQAARMRDAYFALVSEKTDHYIVNTEGDREGVLRKLEGILSEYI
ncbi:MAG: hypothetical protein JXA25_12915 [Anaerolineales bacterium]|nr:hypothetical protein [Anaerolineales bacterium]